MITKLAKDENHEVRNNVIEDLDVMADALGKDGGVVSALLPALVELSKDPKWRVRQAVVNKSGMLAKHLGVKNFEKKLQNLVVLSLSDHVFSIRENCCQQLRSIVETFGGEWAAESFFPTALQVYDKGTNYLHRMTCLLLISSVAPVCSPEVISKSLLPLVMLSCTDDVPNVRIAASKTLLDVIPRLSEDLPATVKPALQKLTTDEDQDVAYFAGVALALC
jgi:serine/threonine-protein phosphatase 2A regulatory subunit A